MKIFDTLDNKRKSINLSEKKKFYITEIIANNSKIYIISLFLAILELIRIKEITFTQTKNFSDIMISRVN